MAIKLYYMRIIYGIAALLLSQNVSYSQRTDQIGVWLDLLPYGAGVEVIQDGNVLYCAVEQGLFTYNLQDRDIQRFSKLNGLSDVNISAMAISRDAEELIIGYENANIDILRGEEVINVPDIYISANYPGLKTINSLLTYKYNGQNLCYIATDFGIVVLDIDSRIIRGTYIIGPNGQNLKVNQIAINSATDSIYAATDEGLYMASLDSALQFFANWKKDLRFNKRIKFVTVVKDRVFIDVESSDNRDSAFALVNGKWKFQEEIERANYNYFKENNGYLSTCYFGSSQIYQYANDTLKRINLVYSPTNIKNPRYSPSAALVESGDERMLWSLDREKGLYRSIQYPGYIGDDILNVLPNSPSSKSVLKMHNSSDRLFVAPGGRNEVWAPVFAYRGFSILEDFVWENFAPADLDSLPDILAIMSDPADPRHFFISSYGRGIAEFRDDKYVRFISEETEGKENFPGIGNSKNHRVGGFSYDGDGNLWFTNSLTNMPLGVIRPDGSVECFGLGAAVSSSVAIGNIMYTSEDQIWIQTRSIGIVVAKMDGNQIITKRLQASENQGNLPTETVLCFAEDKDGEVWVGTNEGVAVLYSPRNIFEPNRNFDTQRILIDLDGDGYGDPFLGGEAVNDIEVDGSNKKWFATSNSGVFYTSDDGRQVIYHFTRDNSPLLSNTVVDIEINDETGMVYFATDQGIVSFQGVATEGSDSNEDVYAYPNPVRPGYTGPILIRGLVTNAQVKITDIEGNIVYETVAEGGQAIWSGKRFDGQRVSSGVYLAFITDDLGVSTAMAKILIVN